MPRRRDISEPRNRLTVDRSVIAALGGNSPHERRVARVATRLFDLLAPLHGMGKSHRRLLRLAALLHDAGRERVGAADHQIHGANIIKDDTRLPLTDAERRGITYLVQHHCGRVPALGADDVLVAGDRKKKLRILLGLLRAADGLDSRRFTAPAIIAQRSGKRLKIRCVVPKRLKQARQQLTRKSKFDLLEQSLGLRVRLGVVSAQQHAAIS